jgi:hypothetical protein
MPCPNVLSSAAQDIDSIGILDTFHGIPTLKLKMKSAEVCAAGSSQSTIRAVALKGLR